MWPLMHYRPPCRHCLRRRVGTRRCRGLCWACSRDPAVRGLYRPAVRPGSAAGGRRVPPDEPTDAAPGTAAKVEVMRARLEAGRSAFHPRDRGAWHGLLGLLARIERGADAA